MRRTQMHERILIVEDLKEVTLWIEWIAPLEIIQNGLEAVSWAEKVNYYDRPARGRKR